MIAIVNYGAGNTRSLATALGRIGRQWTVTDDPDAITDAEHVVLPGVGSAASAMAHLRATGVATALTDRAATGRPTLGICLGMQLSVDSSEEDGGVTCLGLTSGRVIKMTNGRVPRIGWASVDGVDGAMYFAHSYRVEAPAVTAYSEGVAAVLRAGAFTGVQFHPEKSGPSGERFLAQCLPLD
jgi:imidazole glycerol-phosphate synthase subunit HisH